MFKLKPLSPDALPHALDRAEQYRLLNQPWQAESICRDILRVDPHHQKALTIAILSITDQFGSIFGTTSPIEAFELIPRLENKYHQLYFKGLIHERQGKAAYQRNTPHVKYIAYKDLTDAMGLYEEAEKIRPENNDESILRWNACARMIREYNLEADPDEEDVPVFLDV